jgi:hypothetical protein
MSHRAFERRTLQTGRELVKRLLWFGVLLVAIPADPQSAGPEFPNPGNAHMSRDKQHALGLQTAAQVYQQMPVLPDSSPETQYVRQLGQKLVATIPSQNSWPFEFHVVAQKEINAFALPGGQMFINIGTITAASNEAELAGVMAHEMSHVYMQHSAKQAYKAEWEQGIAGLAGGVLGATEGGLIGQLGQMGIQMTEQGMMLKYSRGDEAQADAVGAMILYKAGYNPQALADFFKTLESQGGGAPPQWLSDHPNPGNREQAIEKEIRNWPPEDYASESPAFQKTRQHATAVKAYTGQEIAQGAKSGEWAALNKKNGAMFTPTGESAATTSPASTAHSSPPNVAAVSLQSVLPSQRMLTTDLGPAKIQHPENWQVTMPKQLGQFVTIAPQAGIGAKGVGYGVLLNGVAASQQPMSIDDVTGRIVQDMQQSNGVQPVGKAQAITVGGIQGRSINLQSTSPFPAANGQPQKERDWLVTIPQHDGSVILMIFVAPESEFARFRPTYEAMLKSLQF